MFHVRLERFMNQFVYKKGGEEKGVFGRVQDYAVRYEVQDRG